MKIRNGWFGALAALVSHPGSTAAPPPYEPRSGDIVFQVSSSAQAEAVRLATGGTYGHMGIVFMTDGRARVLEAGGQSVHYTSLGAFLKQSKEGRYAIKRLQGKALATGQIAQLRAAGERFLGRPYDGAFSWSDAQLYCSELVWKTFHSVLGVQLGAPGKLGDFDLSHPAVRRMLESRYGGAVPLRETVIAPQAVFESDRLEIVYESARRE